MFRRSPSRPLRPTVVNTVGLNAPFSVRYPMKVEYVQSLSPLLSFAPHAQKQQPVKALGGYSRVGISDSNFDRQRESSVLITYWFDPLNHRDDLSGPALRNGSQIKNSFSTIRIKACFLGRVDLVFGHSSHHLRGSIEACVEREFFIEKLLVRIHLIFEII